MMKNERHESEAREKEQLACCHATAAFTAAAIG